MKITRKDTAGEKEKRDLQKEVEQLERIVPEHVLPEVLPLLKSHIKSRKEKLRTFEDSHA
jgi:hypothetical protein